jgi:transcriptional regulator with XRE-family HTH domain
MTLGERIKKLRERRGYESVREFARRAGVKHVTLSKLERGLQTDVTTETAKKIARALGVSLDYLVGMYEDEELGDPEPTGVAVLGAPTVLLRCIGYRLEECSLDAPWPSTRQEKISACIVKALTALTILCHRSLPVRCHTSVLPPAHPSAAPVNPRTCGKLPTAERHMPGEGGRHSPQDMSRRLPRPTG